MRLSKHQFAILSITLCTIITSAAAPLFKWSMLDTPPFTLAFLRFLLATIIMLPLVYNRIKIKFEDFYKILLLALTCITFNTGFYFLGLSLSQSINAPIIDSSVPLFLIIGAVLFLKETPKPKMLFGMAVSLIGILIIIIRPSDHISPTGSILGNIFLLLSVFSLVGYTLLLKKFKLSYPASTLLFWMFLLATITFFPLYILGGGIKSLIPHLDIRGYFGIMYGAVFSSILCQIFYTYSVKALKSDEIGIFMYLGPVITALIAIPLLHEEITFSYLLGSAFVFLGLIIAEVKFHYHRSHHHLENDPWLESGP